MGSINPCQRSPDFPERDSNPHSSQAENMFSGQKGSEARFHYPGYMLIYIKSSQVAVTRQLLLSRIIMAFESFNNELVSELVIEQVHSLTGVTAILTQTWLRFAWCFAVVE